MTTAAATFFESEEDLRKEIEGLRHDLLGSYTPLVVVVTWLWFVIVLVVGGKPGINDLPLGVSVFSALIARDLRDNNFRLAVWVFIVGLAFIHFSFILAYPLTIVMIFGAIAVVMAGSLMGRAEAIIASALTWAAGLLAMYLSKGMIEWRAELFVVLIAYYMVLGVSWMAGSPLRTSVVWALNGWGRTHNALDEVQRRRAELYRALRALEEATYRVERMNNELVVAQREAETAKALKARFAATVSHELRGPLNLVLGFSKLMALSPESYGETLPRSYRADVDAIYRNVQHLVALVDDILDLSQIEASQLPLVRDRIEINSDVIERVIHIVQPLADRRSLELRTDLAPELPSLLADPVRLRQALLNLLTNALRFTNEGSITVRSSVDGEQVRITVEDTGAGIPANDIPRLFKEFHQVHERGDTTDGSGLGLAISKHLIELHDGRIWVESTEGMGTAFHFTLPQSGVSRSSTTSVDKRPPKGETEQPHCCLVVHDDPGVVRLLARHIEGFRVVGLPDDENIVDLVKQLHPAAVVTDNEYEDGVRSRLRATEYDVPVICCKLPRLWEEASITGVVSYLIKPIMADALWAVVRGLEKEGQTTIMIVDDDPDAVRLIERMLLTFPRPYRILKAYDGQQALESMRSELPDVVLLDLLMKGMDGRETVRSMRADETLAQVPVVIVSARGWIDEKVQLGTTLKLERREPIDVSHGSQCLQALLSSLPARYVSGPVPRSQSGAEARG